MIVPLTLIGVITLYFSPPIILYHFIIFKQVDLLKVVELSEDKKKDLSRIKYRNGSVLLLFLIIYMLGFFPVVLRCVDLLKIDNLFFMKFIGLFVAYFIAFNILIMLDELSRLNIDELEVIDVKTLVRKFIYSLIIFVPLATIGVFKV